MDTTYRLTQTGAEVQEALNQVPENEQAIGQLNENKVNKEEGKGLSEANFNNAEKSKLDALPTRAELTEEENLKADKAYVVLNGADRNVFLSTRNLPDVRLSSAGTLNVYDILKYKTLILTQDAVKTIEEVFA